MRPPIAEQILELQELPTLPLVVTKIIATTNDPNSTATDLQNLILSDQAIAAKILKLANSAFYGLPGRVNNLGRAVTLLGFQTVRSLALSISVIDTFKGSSNSRFFDRTKYWEHSLAVASCSRLLAAKYYPEMKDEAYMAGLFHDIGKIILDQYFFEYFAAALELAHREDISSWEAEDRILGINHADIGAEVASRWNFPRELVEVIRYHHKPQVLPDNPLLELVALSNLLCQEWEFGQSGSAMLPALPEEIRGRYVGTQTEEEILQAKLESEFEKSAALIAMFT